MLLLCYQSIYPSSLSSRCGHVIAAVTSWCRLRCHIIVVSSLPSWCHLRVSCGFVITIVVSPSHWLQFRCHHCSVAFALVAVSLLPSWCRLRIGRGFVVAIVVSPL